MVEALLSDLHYFCLPCVVSYTFLFYLLCSCNLYYTFSSPFFPNCSLVKKNIGVHA